MPEARSQLLGSYINIDKAFFTLKLSIEKFSVASDNFISNITPPFNLKPAKQNDFKIPFQKIKKHINKLKKTIASKLPDKLLRSIGQISKAVSGRILIPIKEAFFKSKLGDLFTNKELEKQRKVALFFAAMLIILVPVAFLILKNPTKTAAWYNDDWLYRKSVLVGKGTGTETDVIINFTGGDAIDTSDSDKFNSDCSDFRFTKDNGELLPHYVESGCGTTTTVVHVYFENLRVGSQTIYYYYGNKNANNISSNESFLIKTGDGTDGAVTFSTDTNINTDDTIGSRSCTDGGDAVSYSVDSLTLNTATLKTTPNSNCLATGDTIMLINLQGTETKVDNVGNYELLEIESISTNVITFTSNKIQDYGGGGDDDTNIGTLIDSQRVMLQRVPEYGNVTVNSGVRLYASDWDGTSGGVLAFLSNGTVTVNGTIDTNNMGYRRGTYGADGGDSGESFCGNAIGGTGGDMSPVTDGENGVCGGGGGGGAIANSTLKDGGSGSSTSGGSGGGGGASQQGASHYQQPYGGCGGGGGYGSGGGGGGGGTDASSGGTNSSADGADATNVSTDGRAGGGGGGGTYGQADLSRIYHGTGGGAGGDVSQPQATFGRGGDGGGIIYISASTVTVNGEVSSGGDGGENGTCYDGGDGQIDYGGGGGGGAGGSIYFGGNTVTLGTSLVSTTGGTGGQFAPSGCYKPFNEEAGDGGNGRIHVDYTDSVSGSTTDAAYNSEEHTSEAEDYTIGTPSGEEKGVGTVLHWKLDEATGSIVNDESSANNDGTISNAAWRPKEICLIEYCLSFDGNDDEITTTDNNLLDFDGSGSFTIQAWVRKPEMLYGREAIISKFETSGIDGGFEMYFDGSGNVYFGIDNNNTSFPADSASDTSTDYSDGEWHMITGVKDSTSSIKLYIDGNLMDTDSSLSASGDISNNDNLYVGARNGVATHDLKAFIDEVKIYPYARSAEEVVGDYAVGKAGQSSTHGGAAVFGAQDQSFLTKGLVGYWKMDETSWVGNCSASDALDSSGEINDMKSCGDSDLTTGKFGGGVSFDGSMDYIVVNSKIIGGNEQTSFSAWVKPAETTDQRIIEQISGHINLYIDGSGNWRVGVQNDTTGAYPNGGSATADVWTHVMGVYDGNYVHIYINGALIDSDPLTGTIKNSDNGFIVGCNGNTSETCTVGSEYEFEGEVDEIRAYNRALSATEVSSLYNWAPGPVGEWKLDERTPTATLNDTSGYENDLSVISFGNYFGDGSDGDVILSTNTSFVNAADGDYVIKEYNSLTINSGVTVTTQNRAKGLFIYVKGDVTIDGTLSMTARGANSNPTGVNSGGIRLPMLINGGTDTLSAADFAGAGSDVITAVANQSGISGDGTIFTIAKVGGAGASGTSASEDGAPGGTIANGVGGGGAGGHRRADGGVSGDGADGTCFSGGSGGGGSAETYDGGDGVAYGGAGGAGGGGAGNGSGGAGNPGGAGYSDPSQDGDDGTGGIIWLVVGGDLTIGSGGVISSEGAEGGGDTSAAGGASGGGVIMVAYAGTYTNNGSITVSGGLGGDGGSYLDGGNGGDGSTTVLQVAESVDNTILNEERWNIGKHGSSLNLQAPFNGYLTRSDPSDFDFTASDNFTLETWAKTSNSGSTTYLITKADTTNGGYKLYHAASGNYCFDIDDDSTWTPDDSTCTTGKNYGDGEWHHIAAIKDGTDNISLYIDGNKKDSDDTIAATGTLVNTADFLVGVDIDEGTGKWEGEVDDIKVYNYARSPSQIIEDMNAGHPAPGSPIGSAKLHLKFDGMRGDTAYDSSPEGNHFDLGGSGNTCPENSACPKWTLDGKYNSALDFDTTAEYLHIYNTPSFNPGTNDFSISTWVKTPGHDASAFIILSSWYKYSLYVGPSGLVRMITGNDSDTVTSTNAKTSIEDDQWHHIVATIDRDGNQTIYVDKIAEDSDDVSAYSSIDYQDSQIDIGNRGTADLGWYGQIDDIRIYHSVLTQQQVDLLYNQGAAAVLGAVGTDESGDVSYSQSRSYCPPGDTTVNCAPVGMWKLDKNSGSTAYDTSENDADGSLGTGDSSPSWDIGKEGSSLGFDGANDYVDIGTGPTSVKTIEFWAYPETTTEYFINLTSTTDYVWANSGTVTATGLTSPTIYVDGKKTSTIAADKWQHIVVTTGTAENASNFDIGRTANTNYMEGRIDGVKLYNYALTQSQVSWNYNRGKPSGRWKLDECSGTKVYDTSGLGNHGTITIGGAGDQTWVGTCENAGSNAWYNGVNGKINHSLFFDGSDDYVTLNTETFNPGTSDFTLSAWIKTDNNWNNGRIFSGGAYTYELWVSADGTVRSSAGNQTDTRSYPTSTTTIEDGVWHHILATYDRDGSVSLYIDSKFEKSASISAYSSQNYSPSTVRIGVRGDSLSHFWQGQIDDVRIYPYVLNSQQVLSEYNFGAVSFQ